MKPNDNDNSNMMLSDIWLDTESFNADKNIARNEFPMFGEHILEESDRFDEEEKGDVYWNYIDAVKNSKIDDIIDVLKEFKSEINFSHRDVFIYLLILNNKEATYEKVKEFFDDNSGKIPDVEAFKFQELPETYNELVSNEVEKSSVRQNALKIALKEKLKSVVNFALPIDGRNMVVSPSDLHLLYDLGFSILYKVNKITIFKVF